MVTWKPKRIGDTTPWQEPPPPEQREWRTACDYERNHQHSRAWGNQVNDVIVEWGCDCEATQYSYDPIPHPVHGMDYGEPAVFEYADAPAAARGSSQASSGCSLWLLVPLIVIVIVVMTELRSGS
jgi:hypothetical protein